MKSKEDECQPLIAEKTETTSENYEIENKETDNPQSDSVAKTAVDDTVNYEKNGVSSPLPNLACAEGNDSAAVNSVIEKAFANLEPRSRTSSERFHCHNGDEESDDNVSGVGGARGNAGTISATNRKAIRVLWVSVIVCLLFMICEVIGGVWAQSLAIITDAAHLLTDLASMLISLFSLYLASRPASQRMSFGWYRAEVVGAFISVFLIWVVTGILVYLAIDRMITKTYDIDAPIMAITAGIGVLVNIVMGALLYFGGHSHSHLGGGSHSHSHSHSRSGSHSHSHSHNNHQSDSLSAASSESNAGECERLVGSPAKKRSTNINVRAAFIHVLGDFFQSIGVLIAALLILWNENLAIMDPICTLLFSVIVVSTTVYIIRDALVVLLEGRPSNINFSHVFQALEKIEGVRKVHDLRIWALTTDKVAISVHLEIASDAPAQTILKNTTLMLRREFNVYESTVQIEGWRPESMNCYQCIVPTR